LEKLLNEEISDSNNETSDDELPNADAMKKHPKSKIKKTEE